jgi:hypothetical protein
MILCNRPSSEMLLGVGKLSPELLKIASNIMKQYHEATL